MAGGKGGEGVLFVKGQPPTPIKDGRLAEALIAGIRQMAEGRQSE